MEMKNMDTTKVLCFNMLNFSKFGSINMIKYLHSKGVDVCYSNSGFFNRIIEIHPYLLVVNMDCFIYVNFYWKMVLICITRVLWFHWIQCHKLLFGLLPIHQASENGFVKIVELFLEKGCDINARSSYTNYITTLLLRFIVLREGHIWKWSNFYWKEVQMFLWLIL